LGRAVFEANLGKKVHETLILMEKLDMVAHTCHSNCGDRGSQSKLVPIYKITRPKRVESMAQVVACLTSKCEVLSSNPITSPKTNWQKWYMCEVMDNVS
jgi:hypothetical protein